MIRPSWEAPLRAAARAFRLGMEGAGSEHLKQMIDLLAPLLPTLTPEQLPPMTGCLSRVMAAQQRNDLLQAADLHEFELVPALIQRLTPPGPGVTPPMN